MKLLEVIKKNYTNFKPIVAVINSCLTLKGMQHGLPHDFQDELTLAQNQVMKHLSTHVKAAISRKPTNIVQVRPPLYNQKRLFR